MKRINVRHIFPLNTYISSGRWSPAETIAYKTFKAIGWRDYYGVPAWYHGQEENEYLKNLSMISDKIYVRFKAEKFS